MGPGMNGMNPGMPPMGMVSGGILGMPLSANGAQNLMQSQGAMMQGMQGHGMGNDGLPGGVVSMDPSQLYGYGNMGQVFFSGQQQVQ